MFRGVSHQLSLKKATDLLKKSGYSTLTPLQNTSFSTAFSGRDFIAEYSEGEGRIPAFLIPALIKASGNSQNPHTLILTDCDTEIEKIKRTYRKLQNSAFGKYFLIFLKDDENIQKEIQLLTRKPAIIIGTTNRIIDHIRRSNIELKGLKSLVIDITRDQNRSFFDKDVLFISTKLSKKVRTLIFLQDFSSLDPLGDIVRRPILSLRNTRREIKDHPSRRIPQEYRNMAKFNEKQARLKIEHLIKEIKESEDPILLKEYKKIIKKNVPLHLRGYFLAFMFKKLLSGDTGFQAPASSDMQTIFINIGKNRRVYPKDLFRFFQKSLDLTPDMIGNIKVLANYSFVDLKEEVAITAVDRMNGTTFHGKKITVNFARKKEKKEALLSD